MESTMPEDAGKPERVYPRVIFGTSSLGNLYIAPDEHTKQEIVKACFLHTKGPVVFDSAGKYGAGLALESLGRSLKAMKVRPEDVIISNKLGWVRTPLKGSEPTFERGVWKDLRHDAEQKISYEGILECFEQGNVLLGGYVPQLVSVHDPDEYLARATSEAEAEKLYHDILEAYRALYELKARGKVRAIGVGAKNWEVIQKLVRDVDLDWVMFANSMTVLNHPPALWDFMKDLNRKGITLFNSALFQGGFLLGGAYYNYQRIQPDTHQKIFAWRDDFFSLCSMFQVAPAAACMQFGLRAPGVSSIAISTSTPRRIKENIDLTATPIPADFWVAMKEKGLLRAHINLSEIADG